MKGGVKMVKDCPSVLLPKLWDHLDQLFFPNSSLPYQPNGRSKGRPVRQYYLL